MLIPMDEDMEEILTHMVNCRKVRLNNELGQKMMQLHKPWDFDASDLGTQYHANREDEFVDIDEAEFEQDSR